MNCTVYTDPAEFLAVAEPRLRHDECVNGLMLSIAIRLAQGHAYGPEPPYMAAAFSDHDLAALALMTPPHKLQLLLMDEYDTASARAIAEDLAAGQWRVPAVLSREASGLAFAREWCALQGGTHRLGMQQGIYELRQVTPPVRPPPGRFRQARRRDLPLVAEWAASFHSACRLRTPPDLSVSGAESKIRSGELFLWDDGGPRSMAARTRPTAHGECIGFVYTPPEHRNHGYASATVAALSQTVLDSGKHFCTLFTDLANPTSNSVYQRIGYRRVATVADVELMD